MEYRDEVKCLRKEFFNVVRNHYETSNLILKMIRDRGVYQGFSEADLAFRTCMLHSLSDKNINRLYVKNMEKAIQNLRVRGVACLYTIDMIDVMIANNINMSERYIKFIEGLKTINAKLKLLAHQSIKLSNDVAKQYGYPLFNASEFNINKEDIKTELNI